MANLWPMGSTVHVELGDAIEEHPLIPRRAVTGHALTRRRALRHPERRRLWEIVDVLIEEDPAWRSSSTAQAGGRWLAPR
jgi:hypothetical protein